MKTVTTRTVQANNKLNAAKGTRKARHSHGSSRRSHRIDLLAELDKLPYSAEVGRTALAKYHDSIY